MPGSKNVWQIGSQDYLLARDEIHLWCLDMDSISADFEKLSQILSPDEHARARGYRFAADKNHYILTRGILRLLLEKYVHKDAGQIQFRYNQAGKPFLAEPDKLPLQFNVSHSHAIALFAFALGRAVGVDIEVIHPLPDANNLASCYFSAAEIEQLEALEDENSKLVAFYRCWTRKEAYIKAIGDGLAFPLKDFDVSISAGDARLLAVRNSREKTSHWKMEEIFTREGTTAALVAEGSDWNSICFNVPPNI
jgi:4'-phosphopantetheinyl transferase